MGDFTKGRMKMNKRKLLVAVPVIAALAGAPAFGLVIDGGAVLPGPSNQLVDPTMSVAEWVGPPGRHDQQAKQGVHQRQHPAWRAVVQQPRRDVTPLHAAWLCRMRE